MRANAPENDVVLIIGIATTRLSDREREWIATPSVSGVILFARNFASRAQVTELVAQIRELREGPFLLSVDQEGGPVQRFREGFTDLPALARLGELYDHDKAQALALAEEHAWLMATEMRALDIDLSFAPVLDLKRGNRAIGERAFHADPAVVSALGLAYLRGMRLAGMAATIKHFPGHGSVLEDTHFDRATDVRTLDELRANDLMPFADAIGAGAEAIMMAHVAYPCVDKNPGRIFARLDRGYPARRLRIRGRSVQRRYQHGGSRERRRNRGTHRCPSRCRVRPDSRVQARRRPGSPGSYEGRGAVRCVAHCDAVRRRRRRLAGIARQSAARPVLSRVWPRSADSAG
jgi:hypothetical protein